MPVYEIDLHEACAPEAEDCVFRDFGPWTNPTAIRTTGLVGATRPVRRFRGVPPFLSTDLITALLHLEDDRPLVLPEGGDSEFTPLLGEVLGPDPEWTEDALDQGFFSVVEFD
jgi:hypothetical protein